MKDPSCLGEDDVLVSADHTGASLAPEPLGPRRRALLVELPEGFPAPPAAPACPRRRALLVLVGLCLGMLAVPRATRADGVDCVPVVHADRLGGAWARALAEVRRELADRDDVDRCVELIVTPEARRIRVIARLATGGDATRLVDSPDDLGPTILALLLVPARPAPASATEPPPRPLELPRFEAPAAPEPAAVNLRLAIARPVAAAAAARLEVGIAVGMRWRQALGFGAGGFADVALGRWLIGVTGQWSTGLGDEVIRTPSDGAPGWSTTRFTSRSLEIGVELGRRFALGPVELTALFGPRVAMISRRFKSMPEPFTVVDPDTGDPVTVRFAVPDTMRASGLGGGLRARWAGSERVQMVFGLDVSADLARARGDDRLMTPDGDLVALVGLERATWGFALTLGGTFQVAP
jgi:hypothetical protein